MVEYCLYHCFTVGAWWETPACAVAAKAAAYAGRSVCGFAALLMLGVRGLLLLLLLLG
jgi:hypothetical protein